MLQTKPLVLKPMLRDMLPISRICSSSSHALT
jgi:hypothetical protein